MKTKTVLLVNSADAGKLYTLIDAAILSLSPDGKAPDELVIVYADVPYSRDGLKGIQRFRKADAELLAAEWRERLASDPRAAAGIPMYIGHPDYTAGDPEAELILVQKQPPSYGWIKALVVADDGLHMPIEWTAKGRELVEGREYRFFSPALRSAQTGMEGGVMIYSPRILRSCGLTNTPNWPQAPLVNAANENEGGADEGNNQMTLLERIGKVFGKTFATDEEALTHVTTVNAEAVKATDALTVNTAQAEKIKGLRTSLATMCVNAQVARGAVLKDHAATRIADLVNAGDSIGDRIKELESLPSLMKTVETVHAETVQKRASDIAERSQRVQDFVNAKMTSQHLSYDAAFSAVSREHPELFETPNAGK